MKYRIIGGVVMVTLLAIITPILVKNSNQRLQTPPQPPKIQLDEPQTVVTPEPVPVLAQSNEQSPKPELEPQPIKIHKVTHPKAIKTIAMLKPKAANSKKPEIAVKPKAHAASHPGHALPGHALPAHAIPGHALPARAIPAHAVPVHTSSIKKPSRSYKQTPKHLSYTIQLAMLANQRNAEQLAAKLKQHGYRVYYKKIALAQGHQAVKVMVGDLTTLSQAEGLQHKLQKEIHIKGVVVKDGIG